MTDVDAALAKPGLRDEIRARVLAAVTDGQRRRRGASYVANAATVAVLQALHDRLEEGRTFDRGFLLQVCGYVRD